MNHSGCCFEKRKISENNSPMLNSKSALQKDIFFIYFKVSLDRFPNPKKYAPQNDNNKLYGMYPKTKLEK